MTSETLYEDLNQAVVTLLDLAKELTWNKLSDNCKFILTEIKDNEKNFHEQRHLNKIENDKKVPATLQELMPALQNLYDNFYDINLLIYKATKKITIIDFLYYPKSSFDEAYRNKVANNLPMLHCKVSNPPWLSDKKEKFDINWEHKKSRNWWKMFFFRLKLNTKRG